VIDSAAAVPKSPTPTTGATTTGTRQAAA